MVVGSTYNLNTKSGDLSDVISIDNNLVSRVPSNKCLGVLLDEKLTFETHIEYIFKKVCAGIGALRRIKPFVSLCTLVTLYRSLIEPYFDYCSPLWDKGGKQLKGKLQKIQNRAGRVTTGFSYDVRSADVLNVLKWKTLKTRRFHTKATLMYKILNDLSAPQLSKSFVKLNDTNVNYNLRNIETDLARPRPYTNFLKRSLSIVVQCFGTIFPMRQRPHNRFRILNTNLPPRLPCPLLDHTDSVYNMFYFKYMYIYIRTLL